MIGRPVVALALVAAVVCGACAGDESSDPAGTGAPSDPTGTSSPSRPSPPPTLRDAPEALDKLSPGLLGAARLGVPETWAPFDFDPSMVGDPEFAGDLDPFTDLVTCPAGVVRDDDAPWLARRYTTLDAPLDNGIITVELILESESSADHADDVEALSDCVAIDGATVSWTDGTVAVEAAAGQWTYETTTLTVASGPTEQTPFDMTYVATWANDGEATAGVILGGQPATDDWSTATTELLARVLVALADARV